MSIAVEQIAFGHYFFVNFDADTCKALFAFMFGPVLSRAFLIFAPC